MRRDNLRQRRKGPGGWLVLMTVLTGLGTWGNLASVSAETTGSTAKASWQGSLAQQETWETALQQIATGQFDRGEALIAQLVQDGVKDPQVLEAQDWLNAYEATQQQRHERRDQEFARYVAWAKEDMAAGYWQRAIGTCNWALNTAADQEAFRKEPWLLDVVKGSTAKAKEYENAREWYKAAAIYLHLRDIFPKDKAYRDALDRCQEHIRLELTYAKDSDWESSVANISPMMAIEAFKRIHAEYRSKPDFKELTGSALQQVLRLTEEPKLAEVFAKLNDKDEVEEFRERVLSWLERSQRREEMSLTDIIDVFERVRGINRELNVFPQSVLIREFVHGALKPLDQFSDMLWPAETEEFNKNTQGKFFGVGISIRKARGEPIRVITPLSGTPAYEAGIQPGDLITHINGKSAAPLTISKAVQEITGPPDTTVTLTIQRNEAGSDKNFDITLKRAEITIHTIKGDQRLPAGGWNYLIDPANRIGYVRLTNFTDESPIELKAAIKDLVELQGMRGLILDLRNNPGGPLKAAVDVTNLFLDGDKEIVSTRDRRGQDMRMSTSEPEGDHYPDFPLILLVNAGSASASEIVAGALQDHRRALIVGERSFGKGSVQQVLPVTPTRQAFLKLTTARYYLPLGRCLHRDEDSESWGVDPDVAAPLVPKELVQINNARVRKDILKGSGQNELTDELIKQVLATQPADDADDEDKPADTRPADEPPPRDDPNTWPETDMQFETALLLMRLRLASDVPWVLGQQQQVAATPAGHSGS